MRISSHSLSILFAVTIAMFCAVATGEAAEIYRWVDEDGTVTYSAIKPPGREVARVDVKVSAPSEKAIKELEATIESGKQAQLEQQQRESEMAQEQQLAARKLENCTRARRNLEQLESALRIYHTDATGERTRVGEEERQDDIERMQEAVEENCS